MRKLLLTLIDLTQETNSHEFVLGCLRFFDKKGYLSPKQRQGILSVVKMYV